MLISKAEIEDLEEILKLQKICYLSEAQLHNDYTIPPMVQSLKDMEWDYQKGLILKATLNGELIGSVRAYVQDGTCHISKLMVAIDQQNMGAGKKLMGAIEASFDNCTRYELFTGHRSLKNIALYQKIGYTIYKNQVVSDDLTLVYMEKSNV